MCTGHVHPQNPYAHTCNIHRAGGQRKSKTPRSYGETHFCKHLGGGDGKSLHSGTLADYASLCWTERLHFRRPVCGSTKAESFLFLTKLVQSWFYACSLPCIRLQLENISPVAGSFTQYTSCPFPARVAVLATCLCFVLQEHHQGCFFALSSPPRVSSGLLLGFMSQRKHVQFSYVKL